jgi:hypothetical protein
VCCYVGVSVRVMLVLGLWLLLSGVRDIVCFLLL